MQENPRTSLLIRCSREEAQTIYAEASTQHRTVSGYLLFVLERSLSIEVRFVAGVSYRKQDPAFVAPEHRTAIHLRCTTEEADRIRRAAKTRLLSISAFVLFSLHRHWKAVQHVRDS